MKASVIICTYNKPERLFASLCSFNNVDYDRNIFEVIVCDDGSSNRIDFSRFKDFDFNLKYLNLTHNGRAASRNEGISNANGEIIIFSDDDTIVEQNFISKHVSLKTQYPDVIILGNRMQTYVAENDINAIDKNNISYKLSQYKLYAQSDIYSSCTKPYIFSKNPSLHWLCATTGNMSINKYWINKYGGFDSQFSGWGFEDIELAYRYSKEGIRFYYAEDLISYHLEHSRDKEAMVSEMKFNISYFFNKYNKPNDIRAYWDFFRGIISLKTFDQLTYNEFPSNVEEEYFYLFKRAHLESLL